MKVITLEGPWYFCNHCGNWFQEEGPEEELVAAYEYTLDEGEPLSAVPTRTGYKCHDGSPYGSGSNPCRFSSDDEDYGDVKYAEELHECGDCEVKYPILGDALVCCS